MSNTNVSTSTLTPTSTLSISQSASSTIHSTVANGEPPSFPHFPTYCNGYNTCYDCAVMGHDCFWCPQSGICQSYHSPSVLCSDMITDVDGCSIYWYRWQWKVLWALSSLICLLLFCFLVKVLFAAASPARPQRPSSPRRRDAPSGNAPPPGNQPHVLPVYILPPGTLGQPPQEPLPTEAYQPIPQGYIPNDAVYQQPPVAGPPHQVPYAAAPPFNNQPIFPVDAPEAPLMEKAAEPAQESKVEESNTQPKSPRYHVINHETVQQYRDELEEQRKKNEILKDQVEWLNRVVRTRDNIETPDQMKSKFESRGPQGTD